ncbi:hypothetical protein D9M68_174130 [compost metagenome]
MGLFKIGAQDVDKLGRAFVALLLRQAIGGHVHPNMVFYDFTHQAVNGAAYTCNHLHDFGTPLFVLQHPLDAFHLPTNAAYAVNQLLLLADGMGQKEVPRIAGGVRPRGFQPRPLHGLNREW